MWCSFVTDPAASPLRVAFAVGRSLGPATRRNRLRRRFRALVARSAERAGVDSGWLLITIPSALEQTFELLGREIDAPLQQVTVATNIRTDQP